MLARRHRRREDVERKVAQEPLLETIEMVVTVVLREEERVSREAIFVLFLFLVRSCSIFVLLIFDIYILAQF